MTSPGGEIRVLPSHLRELSRRQSDAVEQIKQAAPLPSTEAAAILHSHGTACLSTHTAAEAAAKARAKACIALAVISEAFAANLETAAARYSQTDQDSERKIDGRMRPGSP